MTLKTRRIGVAVVGATLAATTLIALSGAVATASSTPNTPGCSVTTDDVWPSAVQGRPGDVHPFATGAIYMWHSTNGWNIRVTHDAKHLRTFSGQLTTSGTFRDLRPVQLEKSDLFRMSTDRHSITFLFKNYGHIDGLNFYTHCAPSIEFAYQSDGKTSPSAKIVIGHGQVHPSTDPFVISRATTATTTTSSTTTSTTSTTTTTLGP